MSHHVRRRKFREQECEGLGSACIEGVQYFVAVCFQKLCIEDGEYSKHAQWERSLFLGSGISGKTYLAVDGRTGVFFCVKKVNKTQLLKMTSRPVLTKSCHATSIALKVDAESAQHNVMK